MPSSSEGDYWSLIAEGIAKTAPAAGNFGLIIKTVCYDQYNLESFHKATEELLAWLDAFSEQQNIKFTISATADPETVSEAIRKYQI